MFKSSWLVRRMFKKSSSASSGTRRKSSRFCASERRGHIESLESRSLLSAVSLIGTHLHLGINADGSLVLPDSSLGARFGGGRDFFTPGTPLESFSISANGNTYTNASPSGSSQIPVTTTNISSGGQLSASVIGSIAGLSVNRTISFKNSDFNSSGGFVTFTTTLTNSTGATISNVAFLENGDPDQDLASYATLNDVVVGGDFVRATAPSSPSGLTVGLGSFDPRAVVSAEGFFVTNPFDVINSPVDPNGALEDI
ncbi:MAG: hypothetical protein KDB27_25165, partial [Planctomycetales bacterium]|nr:hypothetical protein [Planctomycetales bacterium]